MKRITLFLIASVMVTAVLTAQSDPQAFTRKVLLEQFTTAQCGYCPAGAERLLSATDGLNNFVWIRYHAGFGTDDLTNEIAEAMTRFYGGGTFAPAMMLDRSHFDQSRPGPVMSIGQVSDIRQYVTQAKSVKTYCKVQAPEVDYDVATRTLVCTVTGRFSDEVYGDSTRLQVLFIEDSIYMSQSDYGVGHYVNYCHLGVVRDTLTPLWGTAIEVSTDANHTFSHTFTYTIPDDYVYKNCKVVAVVYNYDPSDINNCQVLNAAISDHIDQYLGIGEMSEGLEVRLFPNPAQDLFVLESDSPVSRVTICDAMGRTFLSFPADKARQASFDISSLSAGIYIVRIQTESGFATRQLIVR